MNEPTLRNWPLWTAILLALALTTHATAAEQAEPYDVVIYGGTSSGIAAAVQVAREGKTVVLVEPGEHLGGLTSGGLGWTDSGNKAVIGGVSREFYQRVKKHYDDPANWEYQKPEQYGRYRPEDDAMWTFEPHVAEKIYEQMLEEAGVPVVKNSRLDRQAGVKLDGRRITSITTENGKTFEGRMFVDATYEGDLMAAAKVSYTVGREANTKYGEALNGVQKRKNTHKHRFVVEVDPYVKPGDPASGTLPGINPGDPGEEGAGDHRIQAYCFRMCMSNVAENRVPFPKPEGYDEQEYELLFRNFEAGDLRLPLKPDMMPEGKTDTNNNCAVSTDYIGMNYEYPEASYAEREKILAAHETYQKGLMWSLANHPRVPESIRNQMKPWGLAADEFTDNGNWPHQAYIREARRMVSDYVVTELDCRRVRVADDSVGLGSYNMDSHNCQRYITPEGHVQNEGDVQESPGGPYIVSYRSIVPKDGEAENLLVPVCVSASHIAYGSIRMEPVFMILGQSAASAAVIAIDENVSVQKVDYAGLREKLLADGQVLDLPASAGPKVTITSKSLPGLVIDDRQAKLTGQWLPSNSISPYIDAGYQHDNHEDQGQKSARFEARLNDGIYEVRVAYSANPNRASNVPVTVEHATDTRTVQLDQRKQPEIDKLFTAVGRYQFTDKKPAVVTIGNEQANGHVIIDAVQFVRLKVVDDPRGPAAEIER
jgi:hypothetical protein